MRFHPKHRSWTCPVEAAHFGEKICSLNTSLISACDQAPPRRQMAPPPTTATPSSRARSGKAPCRCRGSRRGHCGHYPPRQVEAMSLPCGAKLVATVRLVGRGPTARAPRVARRSPRTQSLLALSVSVSAARATEASPLAAMPFVSAVHAVAIAHTHTMLITQRTDSLKQHLMISHQSVCSAQQHSAQQRAARSARGAWRCVPFNHRRLHDCTISMCCRRHRPHSAHRWW